jgi:uncharacterized protein YjiS (DUF1127 family)
MFANLQRTAALFPPMPHPSGFRRVVSGAAQSVGSWLEMRRQLRALAALDDHLLRDIGLSRADVERACSGPFGFGDTLSID